MVEVTLSRNYCIALASLVVLLPIIIFVYRKATAWSAYEGHAVGVLAKGDSAQRGTTAIGKAAGVWLGKWRQVTVFEISPELALTVYRVGYKPTNGDQPMIENKMFNGRRFRVRNGAEDCFFFVIAVDTGKEIPIRLVTQTDVDDPAYQDAVLH